MLKKTIEFDDFNGVHRKEDHYFNLMKSEIMELELGITGGLTEMIQKVVQTKDVPALIDIFKDLICRSYGQKSADGKQFIKSKEITTAFTQTEAYSELFMELATDDLAAAEFVNGIMPKAMQVDDTNKLLEEAKKNL